MTAATAFRRSRAILVGVDRYVHGVPPLQTPVRDVGALAACLEARHGFSCSVVADGAANLVGLRTLLSGLPAEVGVDDRLLFYFAGHGVASDGDGEGPRGYILPQDADGGRLNSFLPMTELRAALDGLVCRHVLVIFDCCFAGAFRWSGTRDVTPPPRRLHREQFEWYVRDPAWQVIASAAHDQRALDVAAGAALGNRGEEGLHSPFAQALLEGLEGAADLTGDGVITATELYLHTRECLQTSRIRDLVEQIPTLWQLPRHDKGEFVFRVPGHEAALPTAPPLSLESNPWRGLKPYTERHRDLFFGRQRVSDNLSDLLVANAFTAVVGPSGSGKSSLIQAGALPGVAVRSDGERPLILSLRPGLHPLRSLASAAGGEASESGPATSSAARTALDRLIACHPGRRLLLVVDQLEELITISDSKAEADAFLRLLSCELVLRPAGRLGLCVAVRSDFEAQFLDSPLGRLWRPGRFQVPPLTQDELRRVIEEPAALRVVRFESAGLVDDLINDVVQTPGPLPLLSFALSEMYARCVGRRDGQRILLASDYEALGGVAGALRNRAREEYDRAGVAQATMRRILLRMVSVEGGEPVRRRVPRAELSFGDPAEDGKVEDVLEQLVEARLVVMGQADGVPYAEPAHDALVRGWGTLVGWVRDVRQVMPLQRAIGGDAVTWAQGGRNRGQLWHDDPRLDLASALLGQGRAADLLRLNQVEGAFVAASLAERARRSRRRLTLVVAATAVAVAALAGLAVLMLRITDQNTMAALIDRAGRVVPTLDGPRQAEGLLLALDTAEAMKAASGRLTPGVRGSLMLALERARETDRWTDDGRQINDIAVPRGRAEVVVLYRRNQDDVGRNGDVAAAWPLAAPRTKRRIDVDPSVEHTSLCPSGTCLALLGGDGRTRIIDTHGRPLFEAGPDVSIDTGAVDADDDGRFVYAGTSTGDVLVIEVGGVTQRAIPLGVGPIDRVILSGDQKRLLILGKASTRIVDAGSGAVLGDLRLTLGNGRAFAFAADGRSVFFAGAAGEVMRQGLEDGGPELMVRGGNQRVDRIAVSRDGNVLAFTSATEGAIYVAETSDGLRFRAPLFGGVQASVAFTADGGTLVEAGYLDQALKLFDVARPSLPTRRLQVDALVTKIAPCPGLSALVWGAQDGRVGMLPLREAGGAGWASSDQGHGDFVERVACLGDGRVASVGRDGRVLLWPSDGGAAPRSLGPAGVSFRHFALAPDGDSLLATSGKEVWRLGIDDGSATHVFNTGLDDINRIAVHPELGSIAVGSSGAGHVEIRLAGETGRPVRLRAHVGLIMALGFSPWDDTLVSGGTVGTAGLLPLSRWSLDGRQLASAEAHLPFVTSVGFEPAGRLVVSGGTDGAVRAWDENLARVGTDVARHPTMVSDVAGIGSGEPGVVISADVKGGIALIDISDEGLIRYGCARIASHGRVENASGAGSVAASVKALCASRHAAGGPTPAAP